MKKMGIAVLLALAILLFAQDTDKPTYRGRYQLVPAEFTFEGKNPVLVKGIFRIDSETGKTWKFTYGNYGDKTYEGWMPLKDSN